MPDKIKFTKTSLTALPAAPEGKRIFYYDTETPGLCIQVTGTGVKTFYLYRKVMGKPERVRLGAYPSMTPEQAKRKAAEVNGNIAKGLSPAAEKRRTKLESKTLQEVFSDYQVARKALKSSTVADMTQALNHAFADWLNLPVTKLTPVMVAKRHRDYGTEHSEARANLAMRYLRALLNFAQASYKDDEGQPLLANNPVKVLSETRAWYRVDRRQTVIQPHQLEPWVKAVLALPGVEHRDYFLTVLLTGLRRSEALGLTWDAVNMEARTLTVRDPKNHQDHTLPFSDYLLDLLTRRKAAARSDMVFADDRGRPISNFRYAQARVTQASGVEFCIHDLRRTFATIAESLDIPAYALKRLLNHANGADVTAGYIVTSTERLRAPMQKITDFVLKAAGMRETAPVVDISTRTTAQR